MSERQALNRCPYLGFEDDVTTVTEFPSQLNYCNRCKPSDIPSSYYQQTICLSSDYIRCTIFSSSKKRTMPRSMRWKRSPNIRLRFIIGLVLSLMSIISFGAYYIFQNDLFNNQVPANTKASFPITTTPIIRVSVTKTPTILKTFLFTSTVTQENNTPTLSPTATNFPTEELPLVSVRLGTNCRIGPSQVYPKVGNLEVGEQAEIVGRTIDFQYWLIKNPKAPGNCWIWAYYSIVTGPMDGIPVVTPPPRPTNTPLPTPSGPIPNIIQPTSAPVKPTSVPVPTEDPTPTENPGEPITDP